MSVGRVIHSDACVAEGANWLADREPRFALALAQTGPLPLRLKPDGFDQLLSAIVSQQVSTASAAAIWGRLQAAGLTDSEKVSAARAEDLRAVGLSRQKIHMLMHWLRQGSTMRRCDRRRPRTSSQL